MTKLKGRPLELIKANKLCGFLNNGNHLYRRDVPLILELILDFDNFYEITYPMFDQRGTAHLQHTKPPKSI